MKATRKRQREVSVAISRARGSKILRPPAELTHQGEAGPEEFGDWDV